MKVIKMEKMRMLLRVVFVLFVSSLFIFNGKMTSFQEPELVLVKGGEFVMGKEVPPTEQGDKKRYVNNPAHKVVVDSFYIDKYEVTNRQYFLFCKATARKLPIFWGMNEFHCGLDFPNHPVVGVSQSDALAYAQWRGVRLPTEAEWEYAARGGLIGKKYPNGDEIDKKSANYAQNLSGTTAVGSWPANGFGLYDMAGNVREWVSDWYQTDYYLQGPAQNPQGPEVGRFRVIRGGSWFSGPGCVTVYRRNALAPNWVDFAVGFRCAKDAQSKKAKNRDLLELTYIANEGVMLASGSVKILIDALFTKPHPDLRAPPGQIIKKIVSGQPPFNNIGLVLVTHNHSDHFDPILAAQFLEKHPKSILIAPADAAAALIGSAKNRHKIEPRIISLDLEVGESDSRNVEKISVKAFRTLHSGDRKSPANLMYLIEMNGWRIFHEGDSDGQLETFKHFELEKNPIDLALVHFWFPLDPGGAKIIQEILKPEHTALIHLLKRLESDAPSKIEMVRKYYKDIFLLLPETPPLTFQ